jgi:hypothetical protein
MQKPENYEGPENFRVPHGYIDVTLFDDKNRRGIPGPDHPWYKTRNAIAEAIRRNADSGLSPTELADKIMESL